jgi:hypothetical protein
MQKPAEVPKGSRTVGQIKRKQGLAYCKSCSKPISGNKVYCKDCVPEDVENQASLIARLQRVV